MKDLTLQQKKFIEEYIKTLNGEVSARNAGYKSKDLKCVADRLLSNKFVIKGIQNELQNQISSFRVHKGYVIQKLLKIAEFSLQEEDILDKEGNTTGKKKLRDTTAGLRALEALSKYMGFSMKENNDYVEAKIITISNLDEKKI